ncbi:WG repeat-containing protein [Fibrella aquatilis]|uniref:WG repeat-containing protein n=1 Tax=Fibrella aquatilis TaxID=2817059 RepID=A0A939GBT8_9BACT|nr:WG repeat-containing protein [Fibrella aquatilis]MBO0933513.1 WG repeat-containing protein [Fibrella aquatilis]
MTQDDLRERIKNKLVLEEGDMPDYKWARTGLPAEAAELGITDFPRLVEDVSRTLNTRFSKILDLQAAIQKAGADNEKHLSELQIDLFAQDADRLGLSRVFVTEQWIPHILAKIPDVAPPVPAASITEQPSPLSASTTPVLPTVSPTNANGESAERMQQKVRDILDDYKEHIPANAIKGLFRAIDYSETALAEAVKTYLSTNFYAAENEPVGQTLRDKLTSTDWRHLVWWDRPTSPPPATPPPVSAAPVAAQTPVVPLTAPVAPAKKSTGLRDFFVALLIAGGLIGFVVMLVRSQRESKTAQADTEQTRPTQADESATAAPPKRESAKERRRRLAKEARAAAEAAKLARTQASPKQPTDAATGKEATSKPADAYKPYDELLNDVGQYGERAAKKNGQWGLWRSGKWFIEPQYDDISVFNNGRATVTNNGHSYEIDRFGDRVK